MLVSAIIVSIAITLGTAVVVAAAAALILRWKEYKDMGDGYSLPPSYHTSVARYSQFY